MVSGKKLGNILLDGDVLTKRQLNKALAMQETGDDRKLGEILVDLGYLTIDDLTEVMMNNGPKSRWQENKEVTEEKVMSNELSKDTKFSISIQTMIDKSQAKVTGSVRVRLFKGNVIIEGRKSPHTLYSEDLSTFENDSGEYNQRDAEGFIKINALRLMTKSK